jgi:hypothetical protein
MVLGQRLSLQIPLLVITADANCIELPWIMQAKKSIPDFGSRLLRR